MKKEFNHIEDIFKDAFDGFEANVDPSVWSNIQSNIGAGGNGAAPNNPVNVVAGSSKMVLTKLVAGIALATGIVTSSYYLFIADEKNTTEQVVENYTETKNQETVVEIEKTSENVTTSAVDNQVNQAIADVKEESKTTATVAEKQTNNTVTTITNTNSPIEIVNNNTAQTNTTNQSTQPKTAQKSSVEVADFILKIKTNTTKGKAPLDVEFYLDVDAAGYLWDFGDETPSSSLANPFHTFTEPGKYKVTLSAIDKNANAKTVIQIITVENAITSKLGTVPTVFSPNGDGINDVIKIDGENIKEFTALVRDAKGNLVFEWKSLEGFWDGRDLTNQLLPQGVYYIVVVAIGEDGENHTIKQRIQLF